MYICICIYICHIIISRGEGVAVLAAEEAKRAIRPSWGPVIKLGMRLVFVARQGVIYSTFWFAWKTKSSIL